MIRSVRLLLPVALLLAACSSPAPPEEGSAGAARALFERARGGVGLTSELAGLVEAERLERHGPALLEILRELTGWTELRVSGTYDLPEGVTLVDLEAVYPSGGSASFSVGVSAADSDRGCIVWIATPSSEWPPRGAPADRGLSSQPLP